MSITVRPVRTRSDRNRFIRMVWPLYRDDPHWVPPVVFDRRKLLDTKKNPFYRHAEMELWLAERDGRTVGRIAAIVNHEHNRTHDDRVGFFGFFESENDPAIARTLFDVAEQWLREKGMDRIRGPVNPSMNDEVGLLIEGFDDPPQVLMTYNPEYYTALIESMGFATAMDLYAYRLRHDSYLTPKLERVQRMVREREGLTVRNVQFSPKAAFNRDVAILKRLYNEAWEPNWGFVKMTDEEFDFLAKDLKQVAVHDLTFIVEVGDRPIGFALVLPDINQALKENRRGGLLGAGYSLVFRKNRITRSRILVLGIIPEFQRRGIDAVLYYEIGRVLRDVHGHSEAEGSWILENNVMMNRGMEAINAELYKRYRVYEKTMNKN